MTKDEQVRQRADAIEKELPFWGAYNETIKHGVALLREYADRLDAVAVSDAMVERACHVYAELSLGGVDINAMRSALESILPIADEQVKDAERYRWLRSNQVSERQLSDLHQRVNDDCNPPYLELKHGEDLDAAIDRAIASAKGDASE